MYVIVIKNLVIYCYLSFFSSKFFYFENTIEIRYKLENIDKRLTRIFAEFKNNF